MNYLKVNTQVKKQLLQVGFPSHSSFGKSKRELTFQGNYFLAFLRCSLLCSSLDFIG